MDSIEKIYLERLRLSESHHIVVYWLPLLPGHTHFIVYNPQSKFFRDSSKASLNLNTLDLIIFIPLKNVLPEKCLVVSIAPSMANEIT